MLPQYMALCVSLVLFVWGKKVWDTLWVRPPPVSVRLVTLGMRPPLVCVRSLGYIVGASPLPCFSLHAA